MMSMMTVTKRINYYYLHLNHLLLQHLFHFYTKWVKALHPVSPPQIKNLFSSNLTICTKPCSCIGPISINDLQNVPHNYLVDWQVADATLLALHNPLSQNMASPPSVLQNISMESMFSTPTCNAIGNRVRLILQPKDFQHLFTSPKIKEMTALYDKK